MIRIAFALLATLFLSPPVSAETPPRLVGMGDSVMAWHGARGIPEAVGVALGWPVADLSRSGAQVRGLPGFDIRSQVRGVRPGDWVIVTGSANDLMARCGCGACIAEVAALIAPDGGAGHIPQLVASIARAGGTVVWVTYYDTSIAGGPFAACADELDEIEARVATMAAWFGGVFHADLSEIVEPSDLSHYARDLAHPSLGTAARAGPWLAAKIAGWRG
ncbi:MAG: SGNH/GDSL hydrolase family protein [Shimia sp.]